MRYVYSAHNQGLFSEANYDEATLEQQRKIDKDVSITPRKH